MAGVARATAARRCGDPRRHAGGYDDFITGWMLGPERPEWGRPVGLLVLKDGSLLIADDGGKKIWRVTYGK